MLMENLYSWLIICSGTTISLLGFLLYSSERELRKKRCEVDEYKGKDRAHVVQSSRENQHPEPHSAVAFQRSEIHLRQDRIQDDVHLRETLQSEVSTLKQQLTEKNEAIKRLQSAADFAANMQAENSEIRLKHQRLEEEISNLREQLQTAENRLHETANQNKECAEQHAQLQAHLGQSHRQTEELTARNNELLGEIDALSSKLAVSEKGIEELRTIQQLGQSNEQQLQREIVECRQHLGTAQSQLVESTRLNQEARARNEKLQIETSELTQELEERKATINELQMENQELRLQNQGLREELESRQAQLNAGESQLQKSIREHHEASDRCGRLEAELADFKQRLEESQVEARREIGSAQQQLANVESREMIYREQQEKLEALVVDLKRELSEEKDQAQALEDTHKCLGEAERVCQELRDENRHLREESSRWKERLEASEVNQKQVSMLRQQLDESQTERARLVEGKRPSGEQFAVNGEFTVSSPPLTDDSDEAKIFQSGANSVILPSDSASSNDSCGDQTCGSSPDLAVAIHIGKEHDTKRVGRTSAKRKWRIGAVVGVIVLLLAGAAVMGFLGVNFSASKESAVANETNSDEYTAEEAIAKAPTNSAPRLEGTFETIRATQVFSGPSKNSVVIANVGRGMKLNVVDSSDGWLEIHSKHGRPPGFIRQEAAVRIGKN
jgi:chromosome segregation ATPase